MKKIVVCISVILAVACLMACGEKKDASTVTVSKYGDYGIGAAKLGCAIDDEWVANQDAGSYSKGLLSVSLDADDTINKIRVYFNIDEMEECVVSYDGATYPTIDSLVEQFGDFNDENIIEYDNGTAVLHVEITNKDKGEYYISVKAD